MLHKKTFSSLEICAGAGGQALGLEQAGFQHVALVEQDKHCCQTLRINRPQWNIVETDVRVFDGTIFRGQVDLLSGGVPCPPFSIAGKQLGENDERNLIPELIRLTNEIKPKVVMLENVKGLLSTSFDDYRSEINSSFIDLGYQPIWQLLNASDFGVPQLRPRAIMIAFQKDLNIDFTWPELNNDSLQTVGESLIDMMSAEGWKGAESWANQANKIAPTIVGGSKKHGGPDLGPTRAKKAWAKLGVNGKKIAYDPPSENYEGDPYLTVPMVARLQGFPQDWSFYGKKTPAYRQVGNAFPPPVAKALGQQILISLEDVEENIQQAISRLWHQEILLEIN